MFTACIITISDSGFKGEREDKSGPAIAQILTNAGYEIVTSVIVSDDIENIKTALIEGCTKADLVLTTGGTGFSKRDNTPEATLAVCHRLAPGIPEAMRGFSLAITPRGMLTRAVAGLRGESLIINLPGSPKAVKECLEYILPSLDHGLEILTGRAVNCGE